MTVVSLEFNEINIEAIIDYNRRGLLPEFDDLIRRCGVSYTTSETEYEKIEPWIQWVTAHTGLDLNEHRVFRLGDIRNRNLPQIWEVLEHHGLRVGAVSPMNAENRCSDPVFFVPDPWVQGKIDAPWAMRQLYSAVVQAVNDNAQSKITIKSSLQLVIGLAAYGRISSWPAYLSLAKLIFAKKAWAKAILLDRLLADFFLCQISKNKLDFASLFLNAGAHIQHHYMFNSATYAGKLKNPDWYVKPNDDPVLKVYECYDYILRQVRIALPDARVVVSTGIHQVPHHGVTYYWRIKEHAQFLNRHGIKFKSVEPRMSRDFVVYCSSEAEAEAASRDLLSITSLEGRSLFSVDNRGLSIFVTLTWPFDIAEGFQYKSNGNVFTGLNNDVAFVAIKNGQHDGMGYVIDSKGGGSGQKFPLKDLPKKMAAACGVQNAF